MSTSTPVVQIDGLTKQFKDKLALQEVNLRVTEGTVFGFLGPNGAGKTTTIRILLGLAAASGGSARIFGQDVATASSDVRRQIGYLPDVPGFYPWMTAAQFLRLTGKLFGLDEAVITERIDALLAMAGLTGVEHRIGGFSRGMKQRLGIAQALMNAPRLLILDEPTSALDPVGRKEVLDMIGMLRGRTTVLFSTHILGDAQRVCDEVAILQAGRVVTQAPLHELLAAAGPRRLSVEATGSDEARERFAAALPQLAAQTGVELGPVEQAEASLEDVFLDLLDTPSPTTGEVR
ncbi:ABC transporter ATP-binding protein [Luteococcus sp. OSA5]|uniref:ABC transporter ATP-binding protein n=1 Tax=Luteococcus sp. OSA5 TaxID=3401630 RepID=UPI003B437E73